MGVVVAEGPQRLAYFIVDAVVEPLHGVRLDAIAILVALQAQQREHVAAHVAIDALDVDADVGARSPHEQHPGGEQEPRRGMTQVSNHASIRRRAMV